MGAASQWDHSSGSGFQAWCESSESERGSKQTVSHMAHTPSLNLEKASRALRKTSEKRSFSVFSTKPRSFMYKRTSKARPTLATTDFGHEEGGEGRGDGGEVGGEGWGGEEGGRRVGRGEGAGPERRKGIQQGVKQNNKTQMAGGPEGWGSEIWGGSKNFALFSLSLPFSFFLSLSEDLLVLCFSLGGLLGEFWWCLKRQDCTFVAWGLTTFDMTRSR